MFIESPHFSPAAIAQSGQCFRMTQTSPDTWDLLAGADYLRLRDCGNNRIQLSCTEATYQRRWRTYFDMGTDYQTAIARIPPQDTFLLAAAQAGKGLRMLRQDAWEMLVSFIISQRKSIPAIRRCIQLLCEACGKRLSNGCYAFPTPQALAGLSTDALRACKVGYRADYLHAAAVRCASGFDLQSLHALSDEALLASLLTFHGVGIKVAQCVMLFGYHRLSAAPVDVWIQRVIDDNYHGISPFPGYGADAGLYQQYLFYYQQHVLRQ